MKPYYEEAGITIYHGDARDWFASVPSCLRLGAMVTDPPYGVHFAGSATRHSSKTGLGYTMFEDSPEYVRDVVVPIIRSGIAMCERSAITPGLRNRDVYPKPDAEGVIWYPSGANSGPWGFVTHQPIFYYGKCAYLAKGLGSRPTGFQSTEPAEPNGHPCPKPIGQMSWMVRRASLEGETILDPFMGSGTTLEAAKSLYRKAIGIEIEEAYCEIAANRLRQSVLNFEDSITL